jgi:RsiW-degrading membrane proteinase PrsW (M82 family)
MNLVIIAVSAIAGVIILARLRHLDVHEKEPWRVLLMVTLIGGGWSVAISSLIYIVLDLVGLGDPRSIAGAMLVIGPLEEGAKLLAMVTCLPLFRKHMNEPADGVIYMACIALGFSLIENYFYATSSDNAGGLLALRLITATPAHILFSFPLGLAIYARNREGARPGLLRRAFVYAFLAHGLWDAMAFSGIALVVFFFALWLGLSFFGAVMSYAACVSPFREPLADFLAGSPEKERVPGQRCLFCDTRDETSRVWRRGRIHIQRCDHCGAYVTSWDGLFYVIRHFGGWYGKLDVLSAADGGGDELSTIEAGNVASRQNHLAAFRLDELTPVLDELGERAVAKVEKAWWFPGRVS